MNPEIDPLCDRLERGNHSTEIDLKNNNQGEGNDNNQGLSTDEEINDEGSHLNLAENVSISTTEVEVSLEMVSADTSELATTTTNIKEKPSQKVARAMSWFGCKVFAGMEWVGEGVVSLLGLDESRFQDVLDGMDEDEMAAARAVNAKRQEEYRQMGIITEPDVISNAYFTDTTDCTSNAAMAARFGVDEETFANVSFGMIACRNHTLVSAASNINNIHEDPENPTASNIISDAGSAIEISEQPTIVQPQ